MMWKQTATLLFLEIEQAIDRDAFGRREFVKICLKGHGYGAGLPGCKIGGRAMSVASAHETDLPFDPLSCPFISSCSSLA